MIKTLKEKRFYDSYPTYGGETSMVPIIIFFVFMFAILSVNLESTFCLDQCQI